MTTDMEFEEFEQNLETARKIISSDKYIGELDQLSPYKNKRQLKNQIQYWCKLLLDKLYQAKDSLEELLQNDPYIKAYIGITKLAENKEPEEPLSICEAYEFQLTVLANSNVTWRERLFDQQSLQLRFPEDYPGKTMIHNQCHNNVRLIYADPDFWKIHHQELSTKQIEQQVADYLLKHYGMVFDFPYTIWRQMVINPIHRNFLCLLMTHFPRQYFQTNKNDEDKKQLLEIVAEHLESPNLDLSGYLASEQLSREQLIKLRNMSNQIRSSVKWCLDNDNKPLIQSQRTLPIRPRKWDKAMKLEQMVRLIYDGKGLADHPSNLALQFFGQAEPQERKLARQAQALFRYREYFRIEDYLKGHPT